MGQQMEPLESQVIGYDWRVGVLVGNTNTAKLLQPEVVIGLTTQLLQQERGEINQRMKPKETVEQGRDMDRDSQRVELVLDLATMDLLRYSVARALSGLSLYKYKK